MESIQKWIFSAVALGFIFLFIIVERKLRKGKDAIDMTTSQEDRSSTLFIGLAFGVSMLLIVASVPMNLLGYMYLNFFWAGYVGIVGMASGLAMRIAAAKTLGRFYTRTLKITESHELVNVGLYRYIRHPGYLADILLFVSAALASKNMLCLILIIAMIVPAYIYRISVEEKMMANKFSEAYTRYRKSTYRLIPGIY